MIEAGVSRGTWARWITPIDTYRAAFFSSVMGVVAPSGCILEISNADACLPVGKQWNAIAEHFSLCAFT